MKARLAAQTGPARALEDAEKSGVNAEVASPIQAQSPTQRPYSDDRPLAACNFTLRCATCPSELQGISIARALICGSRLIIADEPVSMINASQKMNIVNLFRDLRDRLSVGFVYVTRDLSTADYVSDDIAIMRKGEIIEQGKPARLFSEPSRSYTKLLLASIATVDKKWADDSDVVERAPIA